jgi:hypothetical protein
LALSLPIGVAGCVRPTPCHCHPPKAADKQINAEDDNTKQTLRSNRLRPQDASAFLLAEKTPAGAPTVFVSRFNETEGLLVVYQSESGKRLLVRSQVFNDSIHSAQVFHKNPKSGKIEQLFGRSREKDANGRRVPDVSLAGVSMSELRSATPDGRSSHENRLTDVAKTEEGKAFLDAVPAIYATLDAQTDNPKLRRLLDPIGAMSLVFQLASKQYSGAKSAQLAVGEGAAKNLKTSCGANPNCTLEGKSFRITAGGLFDPMSRRNEGAATTAVRTPRALDLPWKNGDGTCSRVTQQQPWFGFCGPQDFTPGNIRTTECIGHDFCVCAYSHAQCAVSTPEGCGQNALNGPITCYDLTEAALSWATELLLGIFSGLASMLSSAWGAFVEWVEGWFEGGGGGGGGCPPGVVCTEQ